MVSADQRRTTTGGPIRIAERALRFEVRGHRVERGPEVGRGPVEDRPLGKVGQVALDLGQLAVEHQRRRPTSSPARNQPIDSCRHSLLTSPHAGVCRKLALGWASMKARWSAARIVRTTTGSRRATLPDQQGSLLLT